MNTKNKVNILLIEDNPGDAHLVKLYLKEASVKHELLHADTFFEGVEMIKNNEISLILLDLSLPDSSGFKTLTNIIQEARQIPIIVLTGTNNEIVGNQSIKAGAQDFLVKGQFDAKLLGRSIRYSLRRFETQLKLEETAQNLAISEKRFTDAQEMAHFGNWEMDIVTNEMKWTDEIYRIFGFHSNSISSTLSDYKNYVHIEDKEAVDDFFENAAKDGKLHKLEHRIIIEGHSIKYLAIQAKVYFEEITGQILLVGTIQDITERKVSEQLILEKNISQKASKIKEEALSDMSFHIRTPLSSVINLLFLLENTPTSSQQRELLDGLKISVDDLSIMVNNLLNFSVLVAQKITIEEEEFNIKDFLQSIKKVLQIKVDNANQKLHFDIDEDIPKKLLSDPKKITQVLYNLVDNAIKNTPQNGVITIVAQSDQTNEKDVQLCFSIKDTSKGMTSSKIAELINTNKLLEHYEEGDETNKQELGLAIVAKLIETMNGDFSITSKENEGSTYKVELPVKVIREVQSHAGDAPDMPIKILLVEDHFLNQIATKRVLTTWSSNVTVDIAENGLIGVEKFREHGYDIILMDIQMPVMNGMEATKKIREKSEVPIIALTANASKQEAQKCLKIGFNEYMSKPFKPHDLYAKIMSLLVSVPN